MIGMETTIVINLRQKLELSMASSVSLTYLPCSGVRCRSRVRRVLVWAPPKAGNKTRICVQMVYLGDERNIDKEAR